MTAHTHPSTRSPLIETQSLTFSIDEAHLLRDITITLREGELVGLIGPNGAGKSTLLRVLGGLWAGASGSLKLAGNPLNTYSARQVARIVAHVPQLTAMDFAFTVREVVLMGRSPYLGRLDLEGPEDRQIAESAMEAMSVLDLANRFVNTLSGGERQRVFIARALAQQPRVLLLDEPTANLDVRHQLDLMHMITRLSRETGLAVLAAIHDLDLAAHFGDRLILLNHGRIVVDDAPAAVLTPDHLAEAFHVQARTFPDPFTNRLRLSLSSNGHHDEIPRERSEIHNKQP